MVMNQEDFKFKSNKPPCLHKGCERDTYGGSRGLCLSHYAVKQSLVKRKRITWEKLEAAGEARPLMTKAENAFARSKENPKLDRVWSKTLGKFIFVKRVAPKL